MTLVTYETSCSWMLRCTAARCTVQMMEFSIWAKKAKKKSPFLVPLRIEIITQSAFQQD
ncbi:hypothetical protein BJX99DRAFT_237784 [Aspergillus californicus]